MKKVILLLLTFSFLIALLTGCTQKKEIVFEDKLICIEQKKLDKKEPVQLRIYDDDVEIAKAYKEDIDFSFMFYENQVDRNNKMCKEIEENGKF